MPLTQPALSLGQGPRGVHDARSWVVHWCEQLQRGDLAECAELGVSELVTNALLHGTAPVEVSLGGTRSHPRIEVRDGSPEVPVLPDDVELEALVAADEDLENPDELLLTFGRGLALVARSARAWGVHVDEAGKVVWFEPAPELRDDGPHGVVTGVEDLPESGTPDTCDFVLLGVPVRAYRSFQRHYRELRREVRLLALAHEGAYPLAKDLSDLFGALERSLHESLGSASLHHAGTPFDRVEPEDACTDLRLTMPVKAAAQLDRFVELLELADAFCREERLLSLARTEEQQRFQRWFLDEFVRQAQGGEPLPWTETQHPAPLRRTSVS